MHQHQNINSAHIPQFHSVSWKQKLAFLHTLTLEIASKHLSFSPQLLETHWPSFIKEHNVNVLSKAILALQLWVNSYGIRSLRVQKELIKTLISLSKMERAEIDSIVISIVISLIAHQKQQDSSFSRIPLANSIHWQFNSHNNPTFLVGFQQSQTTQEELIQIQQQYAEEAISFSSHSILLSQLIDCMRSCRKSSFLICLKIISSLAQDRILNQKEFFELQKEAEQISKVIEHRKVASSEKDKKIGAQTSALLQQLKKVQL